MSAHLLDIVVAQSAAILELLAGEDQSLLVWGNAFLVLNLGLDIVNGIGRLDLKGDGLAREGLDEAVFSYPVSILLLVLSRFLLAAWWRADDAKFACSCSRIIDGGGNLTSALYES